MLLEFLATAALTLTAAQDAIPDDWDLTEDAVHQVTSASVSYASGVNLVLACHRGRITLGITGLAPGTGPSGQLSWTRPDGRSEATSWEPAAAGNAIVGGSARLIRSLRSTSTLSLSSAEGAVRPIRIVLDLPAQSSGVDRVLTACGEPLASPRDSLMDIGTLLLATPGLEMPDAALNGRSAFSAEISCIVADSRLMACESTHQTPDDPDAGRIVARASNGKRIRVSDRAAAEGREAIIVITGGRVRRR